jgi:hypothetical protein
VILLADPADKTKQPEIELPEVTTGTPILSEANYRFAALIASGTCKTIPEAYKKAFPDRASSKWVETNAYALAKSPKIREYIDTIQQATRLQIVLEIPDAFERITEIAKNAKHEKTKLDANLEILDRGGMKAPQRIESLQIGIFGSLNTDDMKDLLRKNLNKENK